MDSNDRSQQGRVSLLQHSYSTQNGTSSPQPSGKKVRLQQPHTKPIFHNDTDFVQLISHHLRITRFLKGSACLNCTIHRHKWF